MEKKKFIPLFKENTLQDLNRTLQKMSTNQARVFGDKKSEGQYYCNVLTSMARLLSTREVCGCFHLKEGELLFSTNKDTKQGEFRKKAGQLIFRLIRKGFREEDKLALYQGCFKEAIKIPAKRYSNELFQIKSFRENVIEKDTWETISLAEIAIIKKDMEHFLEENKGNKIIFLAGLRILIRLNDMDQICNLLAKSDYKATRLLIKEESLTKRYNSDNNLHCELAALERDNQNTDLKELVWQISQRVQRKEFTISKFCCYLCYLVFDSLKNCHSKKKDINFDYLGNSCTLFPSYKSPLVEKNKFSDEIVEYMDARVKHLIREIKQGACKIENQEIIENSELVGYEYAPLKERVNKLTM